eukprot:SM000084S23123  [mRNA]  locus=s84:251006:252014:- [translate_table: standard]
MAAGDESLLQKPRANGASMFLIVVYVHIFRGLYYGSNASPRELVWCLGVVILLLVIITAFIGYVLPWASAIPVVGEYCYLVMGGFSVDNATLNRFFSVSILHIAALQQYGSNNPLGINPSVDKIAIYPYFYVTDLVGWVAFAIFFSIFVFYAPNDTLIIIPANPMSTPAHVVPEGCFLPFYAILRRAAREREHSRCVSAWVAKI